MKYSWDLESSTWWNVAWFLANAVLVGRRGYVLYKEDNNSASYRFTLRSTTLGYVTLWGVFAIATIVFAFLSDEFGDAVNALGVLAAEFVAVCLWRHYFGNGNLIRQVVRETRARLSYLLMEGLGMNEAECEHYWTANETAVVDLWTKQLKEKKWRSFTPKERDSLVFDTGIECGKVLEDRLWEGVLYDVAAFFQEWRAEVEDLRGRVRAPERITKSMREGNDAGSQALLSVAILVANEDEQLRKSRDNWDERRAARQFSAARIAKRKTAAEGILHWPDCVSQEPRVIISSTNMNMEQLYLIDGHQRVPCPNVESIPRSVLYTIIEIIKSGYLRVQPDGTIQANITFKYGNMVFNKDHWNPLRTIQRKPFRYITSATWMAGDVAFVVEQREITGSTADRDGSGFLNGVLRLTMTAEVVEEKVSWVERSRPSQDGDDTVWGDIGEIDTPRFIHWINRPTMLAIDVAWLGLMCLMRFWLICRKVMESTGLSKLRSLSLKDTAEVIRRTAAEMLVLSESRRNEQNHLQSATHHTLRQQLGSLVTRPAYHAQHDYAEENV